MPATARSLTSTPSGVLVPAEIDPFHRSLHHVAPAGLIGQTAQTSGMKRLEAISGATVGAANLWMGQTHVAVATASANHHHGASETAIYVVSGHPAFVFLDVEAGEPAEVRLETSPGDYIFVPPFVPHREENPDHAGSDRREPGRLGLVSGTGEQLRFQASKPTCYLGTTGAVA